MAARADRREPSASSRPRELDLVRPPERPPIRLDGPDVALPYYYAVHEHALEEHSLRTVSWQWTAGLAVLGYVVLQHWKLEATPMVIYGTLALLLHELGHYVAMVWLGFRDPSAFFLPIFGWLASGKDEFAPAYRRAAVYLMGSFPCIVLAVVLAIVYRATGAGWAFQFSLWLLFVNVFLALPIPPFDGGKILHHTLFAHNAYLEAGFTLFCVGLLALASLAHGWVFVAIFAAMLGFGMLDVFRIGRIADELRPYVPPPHGDQPPELSLDLCRAITDRVLAVRTTGKDPFNELKPKDAAPVVCDVWRRMIDQPPGWPLVILYLAGLGFTLLVGPILAGNMLLREVVKVRSDPTMPGGKVVEYRMLGHVEGRIGLTRDKRDALYHGPHTEWMVSHEHEPVVYVEGQWDKGYRVGTWTYYELAVSVNPNDRAKADPKKGARPRKIMTRQWVDGRAVSVTTFGADDTKGETRQLEDSPKQAVPCGLRHPLWRAEHEPMKQDDDPPKKKR